MSVRALLLPLREDRYAIPLDRVAEVLEPVAATRLPEAPPAVLGLVNHRGRIVPVLDVGVLLGLRPVGAIGALAVTATARGPAALAATAVPVAVTLGEDLGASTLPTGLRRHRTATGVATLLDLDATVRLDRIGG